MVGQVSVGSNFLLERVKGFIYGIMEFFFSIQEEEEVYFSCEYMVWQDIKFKFVVVILIYVDFYVGEQSLDLDFSF